MQLLTCNKTVVLANMHQMPIIIVMRILGVYRDIVFTALLNCCTHSTKFNRFNSI